MEQEKVTWSDGDEVEGHVLAANASEDAVEDEDEAADD